MRRWLTAVALGGVERCTGQTTGQRLASAPRCMARVRQEGALRTTSPLSLGCFNAELFEDYISAISATGR